MDTDAVSVTPSVLCCVSMLLCGAAHGLLPVPWPLPVSVWLGGRASRVPRAWVGVRPAVLRVFYVSWQFGVKVQHTHV